MKIIKYLLFAFFISITTTAQVVEQDTTKMGYQIKDTDTISEPIELPEVIIYKEHLTAEERKAFLLLQIQEKDFDVDDIFKQYKGENIKQDNLKNSRANKDKFWSSWFIAKQAKQLLV